MPRRRLLTAADRASLLAFPETDEALIRHYTLSEPDLAVIGQRRGNPNRMGFAVQLCYLRYPGIALPTDAQPPAALLTLIGQQLGIEPDIWPQCAQRAETRREHLQELQAWLNLSPFTGADYQQFIDPITELAQQTDQGIVLAEALAERLRQQRLIVPPVAVIERVCSEALTRGTRLVYEALTAPLTDDHRRAFEQLLAIRTDTARSTLAWLRQSPGPPRPKHILVHLERLNTVRELDLPTGLEHTVHQNRLLKLAREGGQMTAQHLRDLEPTRRYATLAAILLDTRATLIDEIIDLHDRFMGSQFNKAKRTHAERFQRSGKEINNKVRLYSRVGRALLDAKEAGSDPFAAIEAIMPWAAFSESIAEAEKLAQSENFDYLALIGSGFNSLQRYTPTLLESLNPCGSNSPPLAA